MAEEYVSGYSFRIHSYATGGKAEDGSSSIGHFSIELVRPDGEAIHYGFYPDKLGVSMVFGTDGKIEKDNELKAGFTDHEISKSVPLTAEQAGKMWKYMEEVRVNPGKYFLFGRNCEEFVQEVIDASGVKAKTRDFMTGEQHEQFNLAKFTMVDPIERDLDTAGSMEYEGFHSAFDLEQKQPAPDQPGPDQHSDAGDASQQQQFADANADTGIDTGSIDTGGIDTGGIDTGTIDTGGGNNGRNYAAELAALPLGREVSLNWLLEKSPDQWTQQELDGAQASDAYWNSRNPRHADVQNAVSDVYRYLYGEGSQSFRPDGSLPRAEPINALRGNTFRGNIQAEADYLKDARTLPHIPSEDDDRHKRTLPYIPSEDDADAAMPYGRAATPLGLADSPRQSQRQNRLADLGRLMEDIPPFDGSEAARTAPGRYLQQAINTLLWPGKAAPDAAGIQGKPYRNGPILVDGEIGPVTAQALDRVEAMPDGLSELAYDLKRQAAQDIVQQVTPEMPADDLAYQLDGAVNIFRDLNRSHDSSVRQLQKGLNQLGRQSMGQEGTGLDETWQPIAEDGQLGPVTAKSFATLARRLPADSMASLFDLGTPPSVGDRTGRKAKAASQMPQLSARDPNPRQRLRTGML